MTYTTEEQVIYFDFFVQMQNNFYKMLITDPTIELQKSLPPLTQLNFVSVKELRSRLNSIIEVK